MKTSLLLGMVMTGLASSLSAAPIAIFNTGANSTGGDQHYVMSYSSDSVVKAGSAAEVVSNPNSGWAAPLAGSKWINPSGNGYQDYCSNYYAYTTSFDLTGLNPLSAVLSGTVMADDHVSLYLNNTRVSTSDFGTYTKPTNFSVGSQYSSAFQNGLNTFSFVVKNDNGPTGLDATIAGTADVATPEPGGFGLVAGAGALLVSLGLYRKRMGRKIHQD